MSDTTPSIDWDARRNAINAQKAQWLDKNDDQLKLIQWVFSRAYDELTEAESISAEEFVDQIDDALRCLLTVVADLRQQDFISQAHAEHPEAF